jgi:membrane protein
MTLGLGWQILKGTVSEFMEDNVLRLAAALAYYAMFSLGPLLVIVIAVAGMFFGKETVQTEVQQQMQSFAGQRAAETIQSMSANETKGSSVVATVLGTIALIFGATGVFGQLQDSLNTIWEVKPKSGQGVWGFIRSRFLSFAMILGIAFLLLISMVITTALEAFSGALGPTLPIPEFAAKGLHFLVSLLVIALLFAMIIKLLPDAQIRWRDVWVGAIGTSLLFTLGKFVIATYLGRESTTSAYGAAGSVVVVLLWVYYSSLILFFGAEFTQVYDRRLGFRIEPSPNAVRVTEEQRAQEGIPHQGEGAPAEQRSQPVSARGENPLWDQSEMPYGGAVAGSFSVLASAVGAGFIGGWLAHRKLTRRKDV